MNVVIDIDDETPLFTQLMNQIKQGVINGELKPGDPLPSIRQLASDLDINSKTVAKAYKMLDRDAIISAKGYRGTFIHLEARANCQVDLGALAKNELAKVITELKEKGLMDSEIRIAFNELMQSKQ